MRIVEVNEIVLSIRRQCIAFGLTHIVNSMNITELIQKKNIQQLEFQKLDRSILNYLKFYLRIKIIKTKMKNQIEFTSYSRNNKIQMVSQCDNIVYNLCCHCSTPNLLASFVMIIFFNGKPKYTHSINNHGFK